MMAGDIRRRIFCPHPLLLHAACLAATLSVAEAGDNITALRNRTSPLEGVDAARATVTWPVKAEDSPLGIIMAGATLGNMDVMNISNSEEGSLKEWKAKSKSAAKAAVKEAIEEIMEDNPDNNLMLGNDASTYKELRDVVKRAQSTSFKVPDIGEGGSKSLNANGVAESEAEAAAVMAANRAAVMDTYDMPKPPEAANDAPFARKGRQGVLKSQKRIVTRTTTPIHFATSKRARSSVVKALALSRKIHGPTQVARQRREVISGGRQVVVAKRSLSAPLARLTSLLEEDDEDPDAPTASEVELQEDKVPCAAGTTGPDGGPCQLCPKNTYKEAAGSDECTACPEGTRTAKEGITSLKGCWDGPMDLESPLGMVMAGPNLAEPDVLNKSLSSEAMALWKSKVGDAAKNAVGELQADLIEDDPELLKGHRAETAKELNDVVSRARALTKKMGTVVLGGKAAFDAKRQAGAQADAVAFMAAHEASVADAYADEDDITGELQRSPEALYPVGQPDMHKVRGENIGVPGGHRPYYAVWGKEQVGAHLDASVHGRTKAYYESARRSIGEGVQAAKMSTGSRIAALEAKAGPARMQSLDALWEGIPPDAGAAAQDTTQWIGATPGMSPQRAQLMEHNVEHQFLSKNNGPVSLGTVATGSSGGAAGAGFTGVGGSVWHSSWVAASDSSIAKASPNLQQSAHQQATSTLPAGNHNRPAQSSSSTSASASGCSTGQVEFCREECNSKLNLEMSIVDPVFASKHKWTKNCMSKCLGPCAQKLQAAAEEAASEITNAMSHEENLISKLTKEFSRQPGKGVGQAAAKVASDAIKRLEQKAGIEPSRGAPGNQHSVFHNSGQSTHKKPVIPGSGVMPFPAGKAASHQDKEVGAQTGVYDCTGRAITVGAVVGRMIPGRACEDQYLVVTAGLWKVTGYKQPGAAEVVEMKHGANTQGRVGVVLHGISPNVNKGTRVELVPFVGAFTHWKLISGATRDLFLPANVAALVKAQRHNKAGVDDPSGFTKSFHSGEFRIDKSGVSKSESVRTMQAQRQNDWGRTKITEKQDANLAMCPGPSCPTDGPSARHRIMHLGNPFWKYVIVAIVMGTILAYLYLKRLNEGAVPQGVLQQEYVQLPNFFGKGGGGGGTFTSKHEGVELERKGGTRPCPGMKGSDRIVMVENASDRIIMVDVGGGGSTSSGRQESSGGNGDTASQDVGYQ